MLKGIAVSNGIGLAKVLKIKENTIEVSKTNINESDIDKEILRFTTALNDSEKQLESLYMNAKEKLGSDAEIIMAQKAMINDPEIKKEICDLIKTLKNAEEATETVLDEQIAFLSAVEDEYIKERAADLIDIKNRILHTLTGNPLELTITNPSILVCKMLTPSQTANFNPSYVKGIICETGGQTSHAAIIARNLEIPAIMGCKTDSLTNGDVVFINGSKGEAYVVTDENEIKKINKDIEKTAMVKAEILAIKDAITQTKDGKKVDLLANVGSLDELKYIEKYGGEGIGLFRTEFLYMESKTTPQENTQFNIYKKTAELMQGKKIVFRTIDIGGDKEVPCLKIPKEDNPFLGWRAVRICLDEVELFKTQLRALLKATAFGEIKIMIPMISSVTEIKKVKELFNEVKAELKHQNIKFNEKTQLGIMIEIPSAAITAEMLANESDFFSIGTNDLIQYTLAVDRGNNKVSNYYDFYHPAVIRLVKITIDASHKAGKTTGMCGEAAGDPIATLLLLGLGLDSFSMSPSVIPKVKKIITSVDMGLAQSIANRVMEMETGEEIKGFLMGELRGLGLDYLVDL